MQPFKALYPLAVAVVFLTAPPASLRAADPVRVADADGILVLQPGVPYDSAILAVSDAGRQILRRVYEPHEPIVFAPVDRSGEPLGDGSYRWDLRLIGGLSPVGFEDAAPTVIRRSGTFVIQAGLLTAAGGPAAGTSAPDLTLASASPTLELTDTTASAHSFSIEVDANALSIFNQGVNEVLTVEMGVIGVFNSAPDPDVEIHIFDGLPEVRLESATGIWDLRVSAGDFQIVDAEELFPPMVLEITKSGSDYTLVFDGDLVSTGTSSTGSSRTLKRDLELAPRDQLLDTLRELPLYAWSYKKDAEGVRHVGPMAEDFHALFGLGESDQRISAGDTSGLALIAIQALTERLEQRDQEIADLRARLEALETTR